MLTPEVRNFLFSSPAHVFYFYPECAIALRRCCLALDLGSKHDQALRLLQEVEPEGRAASEAA